jgi:hypothetical protein
MDLKPVAEGTKGCRRSQPRATRHADRGSRERHQGRAVTGSGLDADIAEERSEQEGIESDSAINDPG